MNVHQPRTSKNFGEYCKQEIKQNISYTLGQASYVDLVFDVYRDITTKGATRAGRGKGVRVSVRNDTPIGKFKDFMRVGDNKKELFNMIADTIPSIQSNTLLIATKNEHVVSNRDVNSSRLEMCNHKEADSRMFVHVYDASFNGYEKFKVVTVDTDVIMIAIGVDHLLSASELSVEFGTGGDQCWYPIHIYMQIYGGKKSVKHCCFGIYLPAAIPSLCLPVKEKEHVGTYGNVFQKSLAHS